MTSGTLMVRETVLSIWNSIHSELVQKVQSSAGMQNTFSSRLAWCAALVVALSMSGPSALAQSTFGTIVGTVKDSSGALMPGIVITVENAGTSVRRSTLADESASYVFPNLEPGVYKVTMSAPGFQVGEYTNIQLLARQTIRIDGTMSVSLQAESVNVVADAVPVITTEVSSIAETKTSKELFDLPIAIGSRSLGSTSPITTLTTQVGVQVDNSGALSVAGSKPSMLSVSVDGISTMNVRNEGAAAELFPSFGTIAEIRVSEVNNAAEYGGVSDITTVSKGGSNQFHGGLFENHINTALNARNPFSASKTPVIMNNYGAYGGGPVKKDKTFFFTSFEGLQLPRSTFLTLNVPSVPLRNGDLSAYSASIKDPQTGKPFSGNQIDPSRFSPISKAALQYLWPLPNTGAPNAIANNFTTNFPTPISSNQGDFRVDHNISSNQTFFVRGTYKDRSVADAPTATTIAGATYRPERDVTTTLAYNFILTPRLINELRLGASDVRVLTSTALSAREIISKIGVQVPDPPSGSASPTFSINGFTSTSTSSSSVARSRTVQLLDNLSWSVGSHSLKFGGDIRGLGAYFSNVFAANRAGRYTFNGSVTNAIIGNAFAAFLLGIPDTTGLGEVIAPDSNGHSVHYAAFAQDDWKPTSRLTVNYGMRWEYHPPFSDRLNNIAVFKPDVFTIVNGQLVHGAVVVADKAVPLIHPLFAASIAPTPILTASQAGIPQQLHRSQKTSFAPRIGFAWRATSDGKTVVRAGYGRFIEALLGTLTNAGWAVEASDIGIFTNSIVGGQPTLSFPNPLPANLAQPGTQDFELSADINYRDPAVHQWNLTIERELGAHIGVRVSYDGSHGTNLGYTQNIAQIPSNTLGFAAAKTLSPYPLFSKIAQESTGARSNYHALTIAANKRLSQGLQFSSNYVFAKNLSNGQGYNPTAFASQAGGTVSDPQNLNLDYGNVAFTRRHRFQTTFLYELPFGQKGLLLKDTNKVLNGIVGGWQLSGVLLYQAGPFLTVVAPGADPQGSNFANVIGAPRADRISGVPLYPSTKGITGWINKQAFAIPQNNIGRQGSSPIGSLVGPGTQAVSLSLFKSFNITEGVRFQLGAAASNAFNHPNYAVPNLNYGTAPFGTIANVQSAEGTGPRQFQITSRLTF
jgi:Carboxypeptidase regulatory-like domain